MASLAAFAPTTAAAGLGAHSSPAARRRCAPPSTRAVTTRNVRIVRAEAPAADHRPARPVAVSAVDHPDVLGRRALVGGAVSAAMSVALALTPGRADAKDGKNGVYWIAPKDGATVPRSFTVKMGVKGYEVAPAADGLQEGTGHHHIVVDAEGTFVEKGQAIPFDATHLHYGKAQKEATVELEPGPHTLTLQFANAKHESFGKKFAKTISITVAE